MVLFIFTFHYEPHLGVINNFIDMADANCHILSLVFYFIAIAVANRDGLRKVLTSHLAQKHTILNY